MCAKLDLLRRHFLDNFSLSENTIMPLYILFFYIIINFKERNYSCSSCFSCAKLFFCKEAILKDIFANFFYEQIVLLLP